MGVAAGAVEPVIEIEGKEGSEARQQSIVRLEAPKFGIALTRNNVGALLDKRGVPIRFGLWNENPAQNKVFKSGDLIGIDSRPITPDEVGRPRGRFVLREMKHEGWVYKGDEHEVGQLNCITFVLAKGGDAAFCNGPGSFN